MRLFLLFSLALSIHFPSTAAEGKHHEAIQFASPGGVDLLLDIHMPSEVKNPPLVMFVHGGGWRGGRRSGNRLKWVVEQGYAVASIEYRFSQEALFPAQIFDCKGALRWLRAHAEEYGYDASRVVVAGSSAGGHLAALMGTSGDVSQLEGTTAGHSDQSSRVQGVIDYYGPSDFVKRSENQKSKTDEPEGGVYQLLGGPVQKNLEAARVASPATYISEDDPPLLIFHGDKDKTVYLDQSQYFEKLYREAGLDVHLEVVSGAGHGWNVNANEKKLVLAFLKRQFSSPQNDEPTNVAEAEAKKAAAEAEVEKNYQAWVLTLSPKAQAWEKVLQSELGSFYLPIHKRQKTQGKSNAWDFVEDNPKLPRVLLIGDSVSRAYTMTVRKELAEKANVHRAPANCGPTKTGLKKLEVWLGDGKWDYIHFNFGIHDRATPLPEYRERLDELVTKLKATGATVLWASSTPLPDLPEKKWTAVSMVERNAAAAEIMKKHGVEIDDLYTAILPRLSELQNPNDCHFKESGNRFLGEQVAKFIGGLID